MNFAKNTTSPDRGEGQESSYATKVWTTLALSEARLDFLSRLVSFHLCVREVEEITENVTSKFRSEQFKEQKKKESVKLGKEFMRIKIRDEKAFYKEKMRLRNEIRRKIMDEYGENTRKTRNIIKCLRDEAMRQKIVMRQKYERKLEFLRQKYGVGKYEDKLEKIPKGLEGYNNAKVFSRLEYEKMEKMDPCVCVVGDLDISENEKLALSLPPKFGLMARLMETNFEHDVEIG